MARTCPSNKVAVGKRTKVFTTPCTFRIRSCIGMYRFGSVSAAQAQAQAVIGFRIYSTSMSCDGYVHYGHARRALSLQSRAKIFGLEFKPKVLQW